MKARKGILRAEKQRKKKIFRGGTLFVESDLCPAKNSHALFLFVVAGVARFCIFVCLATSEFESVRRRSTLVEFPRTIHLRRDCGSSGAPRVPGVVRTCVRVCALRLKPRLVAVFFRKENRRSYSSELLSAPRRSSKRRVWVCVSRIRQDANDGCDCLWRRTTP